MNQVYTKDKMFKKKTFYLILLFSITIFNLGYSIENKILTKVQNEIITTIDIENESKYLIALNPNLESLKDDIIFKISKKSLIKEKIKRIEINKNFKKTEAPTDYIDAVVTNIHQKIGIENLEDFKKYLKIRNVDYKIVRKKIEIEAIWNELIFLKFSQKIKINEENLEDLILENKNKKLRSFLMSEIIFEVENLNALNSKYLQIKKIINSEGFANAALTFSISNTAQVGGKLGWINENTLNKNLKDKIQNLKINEYTDPIRISGGFLILQLNEKKNLENVNSVDLKSELKKQIRAEKNKQLNQFSTLHFNKVKKDIQIYEF